MEGLPRSRPETRGSSHSKSRVYRVRSAANLQRGEPLKITYKLSIKETAKAYANHTCDDFGIQGYKVPRKLRSEVRHVLKYYPEEESKKKSFMNEIIKHSKEVPDPRKYSNLTVWAPKDGIMKKGIV